ncbi:MAG: MBL fold metallo-hydrolase [Clostridia bacterium]|nr:MBL fold metallo-hydrolase [Clostridia bacterium]
MKLVIYNLASGSRGNCTIVTDSVTSIMVDAGIGYRTIKSRMPVGIAGIQALLITHEHTDHVRSVDAISSHGITVYAHPLSAKALPIEVQEIVEKPFSIGTITVTPFRVPHDARYTLGYTFETEDSKVAVMTDCGHINDAIVNHLIGCESALIESNHDIEMLKSGPYPQYLKNRIIGNNGHLSNDASAKLLTYLAGRRLKSVMLGHLSEQNNTPLIALNTLNDSLQRAGRSLEIVVASMDKVTTIQ